MATDPTIGELFKQALVLDADVRAAVDAYGPAKRALADPSVSDGFKRTMVRTALLLARPTK